MSTPDITVLIVDDDYRVAAVHKGFVDQVPGFRVIGQAHSAAQALESAGSLQPDLVLMDIYLPDGDGLQVIRTLLDGPAPPMVMVISAATDMQTVRLAVQLGALHYLVKPFRSAALADRLTAIRNAHSHLASWPTEASQDDVSKVFELLRPLPTTTRDSQRVQLAPTLRLVLDAIAQSGGSMSASDIAETTGISRATAQHYLSQLEQRTLLTLELKYGRTGRPEHRYTIVDR